MAFAPIAAHRASRKRKHNDWLCRFAGSVLVALLSACGGSGTSSSGAENTRAPVASQSKRDIALERIYDDAYSVPAGFYVDPRSATPRSYTLYHVKDDSVSYELCSDDFYVAQALEEADNDSRTVNGYYVGHVETDTYFEFVRELEYSGDIGNIDDITSPGFARVFKCQSVNRNGVDRQLRTGYAGTVNSRPLSSNALRDLTEYLWQFTYFEAARKKVLSSTSREFSDRVEHTLSLAFVFSQGSNACDRIEVIDWVFTMNSDTGELSKSFNPIDVFEARNVNGSAETCQ